MTTKKAQYSALDVAKYIIYLASQNVIDEVKGEKLYEGITNLKLQKILYFVQVRSLIKLNKPLFEQDIQAWQYGPVVSEVYDVYKQYRRRPIVLKQDSSHLPPEVKAFLQDVWYLFGGYSVGKLVRMTHNDTPWQDAIQRKHKVISQKELKTYYTSLLN